MRIYLVRHGETTGDIENRFGGDYDDHLTPHGIKESEELAQKLKNKEIRSISCSPRIRARETASCISDATGAEVKIIDGLAERNHYGILTGMIKAEAQRKHPSQIAELKKGLHHDVKGSENYIHFRDRVTEAFDKAIKGGTSPMVIVTHGGVIKCIAREILKLGELEALSDCAILTLDKTAGTISLSALEGAKFKKA